jgi:FMN-dependent dehydrogenase
VASNFDPSVTWKDVEWIRSLWTGPLIVKGVLEPADAKMAVDAGAQAIVVSNHGGRQLDSVPSTIAALPATVDAVGDRIEVLFDGGVRSGLDVVKAVAMGARGCLVGRAWVYALAALGESGVSRMLTRMRKGIEVAMGLAGVTSISGLDRKRTMMERRDEVVAGLRWESRPPAERRAFRSQEFFSMGAEQWVAAFAGDLVSGMRAGRRGLAGLLDIRIVRICVGASRCRSCTPKWSATACSHVSRAVGTTTTSGTRWRRRSPTSSSPAIAYSRNNSQEYPLTTSRS